MVEIVSPHPDDLLVGKLSYLLALTRTGRQHVALCSLADLEQRHPERAVNGGYWRGVDHEFPGRATGAAVVGDWAVRHLAGSSPNPTLVRPEREVAS